jgi:hypothetical protein
MATSVLILLVAVPIIAVAFTFQLLVPFMWSKFYDRR